MHARLVAAVIIILARVITGVRALWQGCAPEAKQRVYYANHCSHADFVLVWTALPRRLRRFTRPVAGADYWTQGTLRRFIGEQAFHAVMIDRNAATRRRDPISVMCEALDAGDSLIVFPEGTRNTSDSTLLPFKSGVYHLARARSHLEFVPAWIANLNRVMPKGEILPIPLLCTVTFGCPLRLDADEDKDAFVERARNALLALAPKEV